MVRPKRLIAIVYRGQSINIVIVYTCFGLFNTFVDPPLKIAYHSFYRTLHPVKGCFMRKQTIVGASLVGSVARCPRSAYLDTKGYALNSKTIKRREWGNEYHETMNDISLNIDTRGKQRSFRLIIVLLSVIGIIWVIC